MLPQLARGVAPAAGLFLRSLCPSSLPGPPGASYNEDVNLVATLKRFPEKRAHGGAAYST